jgi:O-antigen ligase
LSFTPESESVVVRGELNHAAMRIWESTPFVGVGLGNFLVALPSFLPSRIIYFLQPVHSIYLLLLSEIGIVGYGLIAVLAVYVLRFVKPVWNSAAFISLCALAALGLVDHYLFTLQQGRLLLVIVISLFLLPRPKW